MNLVIIYQAFFDVFIVVFEWKFFLMECARDLNVGMEV